MRPAVHFLPLSSFRARLFAASAPADDKKRRISMKIKHLSAYCLVILTSLFTACDDDTVTVGTGVMPDADKVSTSQASFRVTSRSVLVDSVVANTPKCYLGSIVDPETRARTTCDFLAQYAVLSNYKFPARDRMVLENNRPVADSCQIRLVSDGYYGDSLTVMKLTVQELSKERPMAESEAFYTNLSPEDYVDANSPFTASQTYTVKDLASNSTDKIITINLPAEYGIRIIEKYHEHPEYFSNPYTFIRNVCPGFYFKTDGGVGSMMNIYTSVIDVHFKYYVKDSKGNDSIVGAWQRMAATEEVIQNTRVQNTIPEEMIHPDNPYTYVKSPTGIFTEVTLPVSEIVGGEHYTDTVNSARISFPRYNNETQNPFNLEPATTMLLIRKSDMARFFEEGDVCDGKTSYITDYTSSYNAYVFSNIAPLITRMKNERDAGAGVQKTDPEAERNAKYAAWEAQHPDWNKVMLVPVAAEYYTTTNSYGISTKTLLRLRNELGLSSVKLVGGPNGNLVMDVTYSRFE